MKIGAALRRIVWARAKERCEYCQMPQQFEPATLEVDHVIPEKMDGLSDAGNLALACFRCNNRKGPNIAGIDPSDGSKAYLFNPRSDKWNDHFEWHGSVLHGLTPTGRATIVLLRINDVLPVALRRQLIKEGVFPQK